MLQVNFDPFPVLTTDRLVLRQFTNNDANELFFLRSDERVMKYICKPRPQGIQDILALVEKMRKMVADNEGVAWAMTLKDDPKVVGHISFHRIIKEHYRAEVGYMLHPDFHGQRIMSEALKTVLDYGFNTMGLHSVEAIADPENNPSIKLLERHHFVREALFKEDFFWEGTFRDTVVYSLITPVK